MTDRTGSNTAEYLEELASCELCEWRCGVNRLEGELGVCRMARPEVASSTLHPAPPESYTIFMAGCNFRCLYCQNWTIAHYSDTPAMVEGSIDADTVAKEAVTALQSPEGRLIGADRLFFSGGSPTCSLPYVEQIVRQARRTNPATKVNFDTNGFMTPQSLDRVLDFTTSITFDLRAVDDEVHRELTGAPAKPVLRNAKEVAAHSDRLWEFRVLLVPEINEAQVEPLARFIASLDAELPVSFLAFRPNFVLEDHPGAEVKQLRSAVNTAREVGLESVRWAGHAGLSGTMQQPADIDLSAEGARIAAAYSTAVGCNRHPRSCGDCASQQKCPVKRYRPSRTT